MNILSIAKEIPAKDIKIDVSILQESFDSIERLNIPSLESVEDAYGRLAELVPLGQPLWDVLNNYKADIAVVEEALVLSKAISATVAQKNLLKI